MKVWFDIMAPKEVIFFQPMARRLAKRHKVVCTSRKYGEIASLAKVVGLKLDYMGRYGGATLGGKLAAGTHRIRLLSQWAARQKPDALVSLCSPEASRVAYGLGIKHFCFADTPEAEAQMRLSVPLATKVLMPWIMPKSEYTRRGADPKDIVPYRAVDAASMIRAKTIPAKLPIDPSKKTIIVRPPESHAAYMPKGDRSNDVVVQIAKEFAGKNILVLARYSAQKKQLQKMLGKRATVILMAYQGKALLEQADLFMGSGGTMTAESALMGVPTILYGPFSRFYVPKYLASKGLITVKTSPAPAVAAAKRMLSEPAGLYKRRARAVLKAWRIRTTRWFVQCAWLRDAQAIIY